MSCNIPWNCLRMTCMQLCIPSEIQGCKVCSHDAQVAHLASLHLQANAQSHACHVQAGQWSGMKANLGRNFSNTDCSACCIGNSCGRESLPLTKQQEKLCHCLSFSQPQTFVLCHMCDPQNGFYHNETSALMFNLACKNSAVLVC